jgi:predicted RNA-binding Zn-ribbon protein involved in translation (DUF1610 family)
VRVMPKSYPNSRMKLVMEATIGQWVYVCCSCTVKLDTGGGVVVAYECHACGNTNLRFIHTLEHVDSGGQISVGIECAAVLVGLNEERIPRLAENETKRKERWGQHYRTPGRCTTDITDLENRGKL